MAEPTTFDDRDGWIWFDGKLVPWREASVHVLTHGLHYASSVFEGQRAYDGTIFKLTEHSERLREAPRCSASSCRGRRPRSTPPATKCSRPAASPTPICVRSPGWGRKRWASAQGHQAAPRHRRLGMGQIFRPGESGEGHSPDHRAMAAARAVHRADGIEGGRPLHDRHAVEEACGGSRLRRRLDVRLARPRCRGDRRQHLLRSDGTCTRRRPIASWTASPGGR